MATPNKAKRARAASVGADEMVAMVAKESVKYGGKRYMPGDPLLVLPDDVEGFEANGLAEVATVSVEEPA